MENIDIYHIEYMNNIPQFTQKSEEWLNQRRGKLTSSDVATALGLNPYKKPEDLLMEKCGAERTFFGNVNTLHGEKYEDEAIEVYCGLMGKTNFNYGMISFKDLDHIREKRGNHKYIDEKYHFLGGSTDGVAIDNRNMETLCGLEVKCPLRRKIKHGEIPEYYYPQVQFNMFIYDLELFDFIEYNPNPLEMNIVRVHRDEEWFDKNFLKVEEFWKEVLEWRKKDIKTHPYYEIYAKKNKLNV